MTTLPGETGTGSAPAGHPDDGGPSAVHVRGLVKTYSGVRAVNGIDLDIRRGEIFTTALHQLTGWALDHKISLDGLEVSRPSLEDVYLSLTGAPAGGENGGTA